MNPFSPPDLGRPGPLCPWLKREHLEYYAAVDHTQKAFLDFEGASRDWVSEPGSVAVLVTGENGCGKSSLAHRCIMSINERITENGRFKTWIVDLSREKHPHGRNVSQKIQFIIDQLADNLAENESILPSDDRAFIFSNGEPTRIASRLSSRLGQRSKVLLLLAPHVELESELRDHLDAFYRPRVITFLESTDPELDSACARHYAPESDRPVLRLLSSR